MWLLGPNLIKSPPLPIIWDMSKHSSQEFLRYTRPACVFFEAPRWNSFVTTTSRECNRKRTFLLREVNESATSHFAVCARTRQIQHGNRKNKIWKTIYSWILPFWGDNVQVTANFVSVSQSALSGLFRNRRTRPTLGGWISQGIDFPTVDPNNAIPNRILSDCTPSSLSAKKNHSGTGWTGKEQICKPIGLMPKSSAMGWSWFWYFTTTPVKSCRICVPIYSNGGEDRQIDPHTENESNSENGESMIAVPLGTLLLRIAAIVHEKTSHDVPASC